jgi:transcription elongation factor Elf1
MIGSGSHEFRFQCPNCGHDLKQSIGRLRANERMTCPGCNIGINIEADRSADHVAEAQRTRDKLPAEITVKFFR